MHILDFIMYFVLVIILWMLMDEIWDGEITKELGGMIGVGVIFVFTIIYIFLFAVVPDWNWIDIFRGLKHININW